MAQVMDDSGAPSGGGPDHGGARGVVEMPDSESLRRSVAAANAAEHERRHAASNGAPPAFEGDKGPVSATSSGMHGCIDGDRVYELLPQCFLRSLCLACI